MQQKLRGSLHEREQHSQSIMRLSRIPPNQVCGLSPPRRSADKRTLLDDGSGRKVVISW